MKRKLLLGASLAVAALTVATFQLRQWTSRVDDVVDQALAAEISPDLAPPSLDDEPQFQPAGDSVEESTKSTKPTNAAQAAPRPPMLLPPLEQPPGQLAQRLPAAPQAQPPAPAAAARPTETAKAERAALAEAAVLPKVPRAEPQDEPALDAARRAVRAKRTPEAAAERVTTGAAISRPPARAPRPPQNPDISPPAQPLAGSPLPASATELPSAARPQSASQDAPPSWNSLHFARELVQLHAPPDWFVSEVAAGRDVRLILSPQADHSRMDRGLWLSCHATDELADRDALEALLKDRIAVVTRRQASEIATRSFGVGRWEGVRSDFVIGSQSTTEESDGSFRGIQILVATPWAFVEGYAVAPADAEDTRQIFDQLVQSLRINEPRPWPGADPQEATRDAAPALGVWKSPGGRVRIFGDGRVEMEQDRVAWLQTPASPDAGQPADPEQPPRLRGRFEADGNLLRITWPNGGGYTLRWKRRQDQLELTGAAGKVTRLKPILE